MKSAAAILFQGYHFFLSPLLRRILFIPGGCRYIPTCSAYGLRAIRQYGLARGFVFLFLRLGRCHPWARGGYDPVP